MRWRERLAGLVREFLDGHALIAPQAWRLRSMSLTPTLCSDLDTAQLELLSETALQATVPDGLAGSSAESAEDDA